MDQLDRDRARYCELLKNMEAVSRSFDRESRKKAINAEWLNRDTGILEVYHEKLCRIRQESRRRIRRALAVSGAAAAVILATQAVCLLRYGFSLPLAVIPIGLLALFGIAAVQGIRAARRQEAMAGAAEKRLLQEKEAEDWKNSLERRDKLARLEREEEALLVPYAAEMDTIAEAYLGEKAWDFLTVAEEAGYRSALTGQAYAPSDPDFVDPCILRYNRVVILPAAARIQKLRIEAHDGEKRLRVLCLPHDPAVWETAEIPNVQEIYYRGSRQEWLAISPRAYPEIGSVHCTDGVIRTAP